MSRCFPFPPPGYERKHNPNNLDSLKEVKRKEKKHKREKKDKEKKKDREKEKDGSDEKHRDKKDRKEKHKDKKERKEKHKDKKKDKEDHGKDKDKSSISEESTVAGKLEDRSGGKLQPKVHSKDRSGFGNEATSSILFQGQNGGKPSQSCLPSQFNEESKFVQELDRRIRDDQRGGGTQLPERVAVLDNKDQEMVSRGAIRNSSGLLVEEKVDKNKRIDRKNDPQGVKNDFGGSKMVQSLLHNTKAKVEGVPKPVDEQNGRKWEDREKYRETGVIKQGDKQKDRVKESLAKEKDKDKEKRKDDNAKIKKENKNSSQNLFRNDGSSGHGSFTGKHSMDLLKETNINAANESNFRKRKDEYTNGFLHESEIRPNKMQRPGPHQLTENGRNLDPFQPPTKPFHDKHAVPNSARVDNRERAMNGFIEAHKPSPQKPKHSASAMVSNQIAEASKVPRHDPPSVNKALKVLKIEDLIAETSRRPPHPDSKYLAEVLTVPKVEDWSEFDHQDWLFTEEGHAGKRKVESVRDEDDQLVWSEAVHIESADICALPYVVPY